MSTAQEIVQDAYDSIGRGSEILATDQSLLDRGLLELRSLMEGLRKQDIILAETVSGTTTTIALPTVLGDELNEPVAARSHLVNMLAALLAPSARVELASLNVPPYAWCADQLEVMYRVHTIPSKRTSRLAPRGQGSRYGRTSNTFFNGEAIADDVSTST